MRVVDVNELYSPTGGGVRTYVDRKMTIMADMGHDLTVIAPGREDRVEERPGGGRIIYVRARSMPFDPNYGLFWDAEPVWTLLDRLDPDVIECCSPWRPAWFVSDWQGRAIRSYFMHGDNMESYAKRWFQHVASPDRIERAFAWYDRYLERFLSRFDTVVSNGPALTNRLRARGVRVDVDVSLGIERQPFSPALRDERLRAELLRQCALPPDALLLLGVGRHHPEKRWPMVIDAVHRAGARVPVGLVLLGHGMATRALQKHVGESPHIRLFFAIGDRRRLATIMASADAYIHGSEREPFGLVVSEAPASGAPLIVPDTGGAAEVARPAFAETYRGCDPVSCADAILRFARRDRRIVRRAACAAAAHVRSDETHVAELIAHYQGVIDRRDKLAELSLGNADGARL